MGANQNKEDRDKQKDEEAKARKEALPKKEKN